MRQNNTMYAKLQYLYSRSYLPFLSTPPGRLFGRVRLVCVVACGEELGVLVRGDPEGVVGVAGAFTVVGGRMCEEHLCGGTVDSVGDGFGGRFVGLRGVCDFVDAVGC